MKHILDTYSVAGVDCFANCTGLYLTRAGFLMFVSFFPPIFCFCFFSFPFFCLYLCLMLQGGLFSENL